MPRLEFRLHPGRIFLHSTSLTLVVSLPQSVNVLGI